MTAIATQPMPSAPAQSAQLRKAVIAATIGTAIEWYDFFIYGIAAGLVVGKLYFPNEEPLTATLAAFSTFFIGFVGRPIGAAIFGHFGDRVGRKATLVATHGKVSFICRVVAPLTHRKTSTTTLATSIDPKRRPSPWNTSRYVLWAMDHLPHVLTD